ncbi:MAG TPA: urea transporter, partial [Bacteroidales bacterium]|nr:urea transporter [Bacteroidales bacterium]
MKQFHWFFRSLTNSYSQIFFSNNVIFAIIIFLITFYDLYAGLFGLLSVLFTNLSASLIGFDRYKIKQGYYGFNALLVGLGLGIYFEPGIQLLVIIVLAAFLSLFLSVAFEGIIGKYALPYLSLPFVFTLWAISLSTREFTFLNLNERGVYYINDLYQLGGQKLVDAYYWWNNLPFPISLKIYFNSL